MPKSFTTWRSLDAEGHRISYDRANQRWEHDDATDATHEPVPEPRTVVDADCPGCGFPEIGYAIERAVFTCSRCLHEQNDRPKDD